jgi:hypothetical protein
LPSLWGEDLIRLGVRNENDLIHETSLAFQDSQDFLLNGFGELSCFSLFGPDRYDSAEHKRSSFRKLHGQTEPMLDKFNGQLLKNGATPLVAATPLDIFCASLTRESFSFTGNRCAKMSDIDTAFRARDA